MPENATNCWSSDIDVEEEYDKLRKGGQTINPAATRVGAKRSTIITWSIINAPTDDDLDESNDLDDSNDFDESKVSVLFGLGSRRCFVSILQTFAVLFLLADVFQLSTTSDIPHEGPRHFHTVQLSFFVLLPLLTLSGYMVGSAVNPNVAL